MSELMNTKPIKPMVLDGNLEKNWNIFKQQFNIYLTASKNIKETEEVRCALLLHLIGEDCIEIFNSFTIANNETNKIDVLLNKFENYFAPKKNITYERFKFFTYKQTETQTFNEYVTELKIRATNCAFKDLKDELIRDQIVIGILNNKVRQKLLSDPELTLAKTESTCRAFELAVEQAEIIADKPANGIKDNSPKSNNDQTIMKINDKFGKTNIKKYHHKNNHTATNKQLTKNNNTNFERKINCNRCGTYHALNKCPAYNKTCNKCKKPNHFAKMCRTKQESQVNTVSNKQSDTYFVGLVHNNTNITEWNVVLKINNKQTDFKIDTGAQVNCLPISVFKTLNLNSKLIQNSTNRLTTYTGDNIKLLGTCYITCDYKNKSYKIKFHIVQTDTAPGIIGLQTAIELNLIKQLNKINKNQNQYVKQFPKLFDDKGYANIKPINIKINDEISPVIHPPRKFPFSIMEELKSELHKMESEKIIQKMVEPTEWVNSLVIVRKPNGSLRICMDPRSLNKAIKREHYQLPTVENIISKLNGAKYFTTLDANKGFWQLRLDEKSSKLCTFNTPYGRYRFLRLPFGIASAPEIYQRVMSEILENIEGVTTYIDDILVWGNTKEEHDKRLNLTLKTLEKFNIKLNVQKSKFCTNEVTYLGHKFTSEGVEIDKNKLNAIKEMERPRERKSLERFLGIINYLSKFIKNYSEMTAPLRILLKKNISWHWEEEQEKAFTNLKSILTKPPVLQFYNVNKSLVLSVDASKSCLGAVLMQEEKPIAYFSRALTPTQCNYAQIEKELLAILVGCERFHQYIYGKPVTVETDHKPLVSIIGKPLSDCPLRLQRMFLRLQQYDINLIYKPGKQLIIADALSRLDSVNLNCNSGNQLDEDIEAQVALVLNKIEWSEQQFEKIRVETEKDEDLVMLKRLIREGWPCKRSDMINNLNVFRSVKDHLSIYREIIFKNDQMVVPKSMRKEVLRVLHTGHLGSEKTKIRARESVYWPGINIDIENLVMKCEACALHRNSQTREPLKSHEIPKKQWQKVGMDLFQFNNNHYLLIVDYYTKYFETIQISNLNSLSVISHIKFIFSRLGIPEIVISDNGPQFNSADFKQFTKEWDFKHITSSPLYPQSNGLAERFVQTIKNTLKKCKIDKTDPYIAMLELRNSSIYHNYSSTELMYGRKIRGVIPNLTKNKINHNAYYNNLMKQQIVQQNYYNKKSKPLKQLDKNENIRIRKEGIWQKGKIMDKCNRPRSYKLHLENGQVFERNRKHIRKDETDDKIRKPQNEPLNEKSVVKPQYYLHTDVMYWRNLQSNETQEASEELTEDEQDTTLMPSEESMMETISVSDSSDRMSASSSEEETRVQPQTGYETSLQEEIEDSLADQFSERLSLSPEPKYSSRGRRLQKTSKYWVNKSTKKK